MFARRTYLDVGGFDPAYGMGYYEDTDLAMAMAKHGMDVVFQPLSVVMFTALCKCLAAHMSTATRLG